MKARETENPPQNLVSHRPWTRWWWPGSAVTEDGITRQLKALAEAGFGGVEISPIYGTRGAERDAVEYLSPRWRELLAHTLKEASRLEMGVDMIEGSGWPFGGPWVRPEDSARRLLILQEVIPLPQTHPKHPDARLEAALAVSETGETREISLAELPDWAPPAGSGEKWRVYGAYLGPTGQNVKRAAPGGEGWVADHFSPQAMERYLAPFDTLLPQVSGLRCLFNDSWEVYGANATPEIWEEFARRRGYDLRTHFHHLAGGKSEMAKRVRSDYRQTIAELTLQFVRNWTAHAHRQGTLSRNQAHGSPGNLLDLYAAADIPETEFFGTAILGLAGLDPLPGTPVQEGGLEQLTVSKFAASAGNVAGKPLISSESFTWLGEHGKTPLAHLRAEADLLLATGINHLFYHGTPYSPPEAPWPGWLFYASIHAGPTNPFWRDLPALNRYLTRCQTMLQRGVSQNDILLYFPFQDLLVSDQGTRDYLPFLTVHSRHWLAENLPEFYRVLSFLRERGWQFDLVSDEQLARTLKTEDGRLVNPLGAGYRAVMVAGCRLLPPETAERLAEIARAGVPVLFLGEMPEDIPGLASLEEGRERLRKARSQLEALPPVSILAASRGAIENCLETLGICRESAVDKGIWLCRRREGEELLYFLHQPGDRESEGWVELGGAGEVGGTAAIWTDPATGRRGAAKCRQSEQGRLSVFVRLEPGESLLLEVSPTVKEPALPAFPFAGTGSEAIPLTGPWDLGFLEGGPTLPMSRTLPTAALWTDADACPADNETEREALNAFSGTAGYQIRFELPAEAPVEGWILETGEIRYSARILLNDTEAGTLYCRPWRLALPPLRPGSNQLTIEVSNLMANRLAALERGALERDGEDWKRFFFVNIHYRPFSAADWEPLPSGLPGPVRLLRRAYPTE